jgi:hypothetical protein
MQLAHQGGLHQPGGALPQRLGRHEKAGDRAHVACRRVVHERADLLDPIADGG